MYQYLDSDGSGTSADCVSSTIGVERIAAVTQWLKDNNKKGIIGEFAGSKNTQCMQAVVGLLDELKANTNVWTGAMGWGGGPVSFFSSYLFLGRVFAVLVVVVVVVQVRGRFVDRSPLTWFFLVVGRLHFRHGSWK